MTTFIYCTRADVEAVWNPAAILQAVDDDLSGVLTSSKEQTIQRAIERAANRMNAYLEQRYRLDQLAGNAWCRDANAQIAAYLLSIRRAAVGPVALSEQFAGLMIDLLEIAAGRLKVPELADRLEDLPSVSTFTDNQATMRPRRRS